MVEDSLGLRPPSGTKRFFTAGEEREGGGVGEVEAPAVDARGGSNFMVTIIS